jgi:hypothetical protein
MEGTDLVHNASDSASVLSAINAGDGQNSGDDTSDALSGCREWGIKSAPVQAQGGAAEESRTHR